MRDTTPVGVTTGFSTCAGENSGWPSGSNFRPEKPRFSIATAKRSLVLRADFAIIDGISVRMSSGSSTVASRDTAAASA